MIRRAYHAAWLWLASRFTEWDAIADDPVALTAAMTKHPAARRLVTADDLTGPVPADGLPLEPWEQDALNEVIWDSTWINVPEPDYGWRS